MKEMEKTYSGEDKIVDESGAQRKKKREDYWEDPDNFCFLCKDGGLLLHCDYKKCNKAYHPDCIGKDNKFIKRKRHWFCDCHFCFRCRQSPEFQCLCCSIATCNQCSKMVEYVPIKADKEFCGACFKLALHVEENVDANSDTARVALFREFWKINKCLNLEDLHFAYARLKEGKCYLSSSNPDKHDYPIKKRQTCTKTGSKGGQAIRVRDSSSGIKTGSYTEDGPGQGNNQNNGETDTKGGHDVMDRDSPRGIQFGSDNGDGIEQENYQKSAEKITKGDPVVSKCLTSLLEVEIKVEKDESCAGKDIEVCKGNEYDGTHEPLEATLKSLTYRSNVEKSRGSNLVHKGMEKDGPDEQLGAILKGLPYGSNVASTEQTQPSAASRKLELGDPANSLWYCIVSDGIVKGPCPLSFLRSYADFDSACLRYKVWIAGQSRETAITLGEAFDLLS